MLKKTFAVCVLTLLTTVNAYANEVPTAKPVEETEVLVNFEVNEEAEEKISAEDVVANLEEATEEKLTVEEAVASIELNEEVTEEKVSLEEAVASVELSDETKEEKLVIEQLIVNLQEEQKEEVAQGFLVSAVCIQEPCDEEILVNEQTLADCPCKKKPKANLASEMTILPVFDEKEEIVSSEIIVCECEVESNDEEVKTLDVVTA